MTEKGIEDQIERVNAALVFLEFGNVKNALKIVYRGESLGELALSVLGFLRIDRADLAEKLLARMVELDDDDSICQIAGLWIALSKPLVKKDELLTAMAELIEKNGKSPMLLEYEACVQIQDRNYSEVLKLLKEARALSSSHCMKSSDVTLYNSWRLREPVSSLLL